MTAVLQPIGVDLYPGDRPVDWPTYCASGYPWSFAIFKLSQGTRYGYATWARAQRTAYADAANRTWRTWYESYYHYLDFAVDGATQVDTFWRLMDQIGGEGPATWPAMLDAERGGQSVELTKTRVEAVIGAAAARYQQLSGRTATLYGGELLRSIGATSRYGCGRSAVALYTSELHGKGETTAQFLARTGTDLEHLALWQYASTEGGTTPPTGYPTSAPGHVGNIDISALVLPGGLAAMAAT